MKDLSIVIINWNTKALLKDCLESIYKNTHNISFEIIVVDNASNDGSVEMIDQDYKNIVLIKNKTNIGFAKANNLAFKSIEGRYVLLLNSDTLVLPDAFENTIKYMDSNDNVGIITPKILNRDGSIQHPCYIKAPSLLTEIYYNFKIDKIFKNFDTTPADDTIREIIHATGAALFIRTTALKQVGDLDERMIFTLEDADICIRVLHAGWKNVYFPNSQIIHFGGESRTKLSDKGINAMYLSRYIFFKKYNNFLVMVLLVLTHISAALFRIMCTFTSVIIEPKKWDFKKQFIDYNFRILKWHLFSINRFNSMEKKSMSVKEN